MPEKTRSERKSSDEFITPSSTSARPLPANLPLDALDPNLTEDLVLALLQRPDLRADIIEQLSKQAGLLKSRKVKISLCGHPNTPRHVSVPLARQLYTFDLMKVALSATTPADLKAASENILISRLKAVTVGERLTLARRASGRVAAAMLIVSASEVKVVAHENADAKASAPDTRILHTALDNPRLTEVLVINSVLHPAASADLVQAVSLHPKWSIRREVRCALLRTIHLSLAKALEFGQEIPDELMRDILANSRLPANIRQQLLHQKSL
jgi:hypothetical protein